MLYAGMCIRSFLWYVQGKVVKKGRIKTNEEVRKFFYRKDYENGIKINEKTIKCIVARSFCYFM